MIIPKIGPSKKKRLPVLWGFNDMLYPHQALALMWKTRTWRVLEDNGKMVKVQSKGVKLKLTYYHASVMFGEWEHWEKFYLPLFSLRGKTVLDVGSGCGETAFFYLKHGAEKVVAVEPDPIAVSFLKENCRMNGWNVETIPTAFSLPLLEGRFDYLKIDCEGCESQLLQLQTLDFPCVIEVHSRSVMESLVRKFDMKWVSRHHLEDEVYIVKNI